MKLKRIRQYLGKYNIIINTVKLEEEKTLTANQVQHYPLLSMSKGDMIFNLSPYINVPSNTYKNTKAYTSNIFYFLNI